MPNALVLGGRAPVALEHVRRLGAHGWTVWVGDSAGCRLSAWSGSANGQVRLPAPRIAPLEFARALANAMRRHSIDLLVPTCEEAFYVARYRDLLPASARVPVAGFELMRQLHSKCIAPDLARTCGVVAPEGHRVRTLAEARDWAARRPVVLKPEFCRFGTQVRIYPTGIPEDAAALVGADWVVQHLEQGRELSSYSIIDNGRVLAHATYRPAHRLGRSASYCFVPVDNAEVLHSVRLLAASTRYTGQLAFDWMQRDDGRVSMLECNPRATSGLHLLTDHDVPAALCGTGTDCIGPRARPAMIAAVMLLHGAPVALFKRSMRAWMRDFRQARDVLTTQGDRAPLAGAIVDAASFALHALRSGQSVRAASTSDIEWDGLPLPSV